MTARGRTEDTSLIGRIIRNQHSLPYPADDAPRCRLSNPIPMPSNASFIVLASHQADLEACRAQQSVVGPCDEPFQPGWTSQRDCTNVPPERI